MVSFQKCSTANKLLLNLIIISQTVNCYPYQRENQNYIVDHKYSNFPSGNTKQKQVTNENNQSAITLRRYPRLYIVIKKIKSHSLFNLDSSLKFKSNGKKDERASSVIHPNSYTLDDLMFQNMAESVPPKRISKRSCRRSATDNIKNETSPEVIHESKIETSDPDRARRCPYDYDKKYCRVYDDIIRCGYDKNKETCSYGSVPLEKGCVITKGVKACGYSGSYLEEKTLKAKGDYGCVIHNQRILCGYQRGDYFLDLKPWETRSDILQYMP